MYEKIITNLPVFCTAWQIVSRVSVFFVFLYFVFFSFLLCFYLWNNTETVILLHWPDISDCILCWPFGQYSPVMTYVMLVIVCWLINSLKLKYVLCACLC